MAKEYKNPCECADKVCPVHDGEECKRRAVVCLRRSDMEDKAGTLFCAECAADAQDSGLFFEDKGAFIRNTTRRHIL